MSNYIKIEWSGYIDFPQATYGYGSKQGQPISGEFDPELIDLSNCGVAEYSIDEGRPGFPTSPSFSFTIKNRNPSNGSQVFFYNYIANLGRTAEYGGDSDSIGQLFIRVSLPKQNNTIIFIGVMDDFEYSPRDFEVTISCSDFMRFLKNSTCKMLKTFSFGNCIVSGQSQLFASIEASQWTGGLLNNTTRSNTFDYYWRVNKIGILSTSSGYDISYLVRTKLVSVRLNDIPFFGSSSIRDLSSYLDFSNDEVLKHFGFTNLEDYRFQITSYPLSNASNPRRIIDMFGAKKFFTGFVQVGNSTILTRFSLRIFISLVASSFPNGIITELRQATVNIQVLHSLNDPLSSSFDGVSGGVFTRGSFQKESTNPSEINYISGDSVDIKIHDFRRQDDETDIVFDGRFLSDYTEQVIDLRENPSVSRHIFIHGSRYISRLKPSFAVPIEPAVKHLPSPTVLPDGSPLFNWSEGDSLYCTERGYFNVIKTLISCIDRLILPYFLYNQEQNISLFETFLIDSEDGDYCYCADISMYGWIDCNIPSAVQKAAFQKSCYVYSNERGKVVFHSRLLHWKYLPDNTLPPNGILITEDSFEYTKGNKYGYGSEAYQIKYNDILEINNLTSQEENSEIVDRLGISRRRFVSPAELTLDSYRTSELGVPSAFESFSDESKVRTIRPSVSFNNDSFFPKLSMFPDTPIDMAIKYARSFIYPSVIFSISIDPYISFSKNSFIEDNYFDFILDNNNSNISDNFSGIAFPFKIGLYMAILKGVDFYHVCMVKSISYPVSDLISSSNWLKLNLILIGYYEGNLGYIRDNLFEVILDNNGEFIIQEQ